MKLDAATGSIITEEQAKELISAFRKKYPLEIKSSFIGIDNINKIFEQENCVGLRIHNGYDSENEKMSLIFVGVDVDEKEILKNGIIYDKVLLCPDYCPIDGLGF
jgi:hypothetical protein